MDYKEKVIALLNSEELSKEQKEKLEAIFPELAESEDERIKREILELVSIAGNGNQFEEIKDWLKKQGEQDSPVDINKMVDEFADTEVKGYGVPSMIEVDAYRKGIEDVLEKQGEQNFDYEHADIPQKDFAPIEPKFKVGDWVVYDHRPYQVVELPKEGYINLGLRRNEKIEFAPSPYCRHWTIADAKNGDVISYKGEISLYKHDIKNVTKKEKTFGGFVYHCCYDGKRFITDSLYSLTEQDKMDIHPATKEQRDLLFQKMKIVGYEWDSEKKELNKIEVKTLDPAKVIEWLKHCKITDCDMHTSIIPDSSPTSNPHRVRWFSEDFIEQFKKDFEI